MIIRIKARWLRIDYAPGSYYGTEGPPKTLVEAEGILIGMYWQPSTGWGNDNCLMYEILDDDNKLHAFPRSACTVVSRQ